MYIDKLSNIKTRNLFKRQTFWFKIAELVFQRFKIAKKEFKTILNETDNKFFMFKIKQVFISLHAV